MSAALPLHTSLRVIASPRQPVPHFHPAVCKTSKPIMKIGKVNYTPLTIYQPSRVSVL